MPEFEHVEIGVPAIAVGAAIIVMVRSAIALQPVPVTKTVKRKIAVPLKLASGVKVTADGVVVAATELNNPIPEIIDQAAPVLLPRL